MRLMHAVRIDERVVHAGVAGVIFHIAHLRHQRQDVSAVARLALAVPFQDVTTLARQGQVILNGVVTAPALHVVLLV